LQGNIEIEKLSFRYGNRKRALKNISLSIKSGEKIAFIGESGSGKTTLARLLLKFYPAEKGQIIIDDYNIEDINIEDLRNRIAYVPQEIFLFSGTVRDNIAFGRENMSLPEIIKAAKKARAHQFINNLPLRYDTLLGERGANLSGGQRQRIAIARAILKKPELIILDEATSNLDRKTENVIHETLLRQPVTTIIIAHRLTTIKLCDQIVLMENGKIIEKGSHRQLMDKKGAYFTMYREYSLTDFKFRGDTA